MPRHKNSGLTINCLHFIEEEGNGLLKQVLNIGILSIGYDCQFQLLKLSIEVHLRSEIKGHSAFGFLYIIPQTLPPALLPIGLSFKLFSLIVNSQRR